MERSHEGATTRRLAGPLWNLGNTTRWRTAVVPARMSRTAILDGRPLTAFWGLRLGERNEHAVARLPHSPGPWQPVGFHSRGVSLVLGPQIARLHRWAVGQADSPFGPRRFGRARCAGHRRARPNRTRPRSDSGGRDRVASCCGPGTQDRHDARGVGRWLGRRRSASLQRTRFRRPHAHARARGRRAGPKALRGTSTERR